MQVVTGTIPETGEWVLSPKPDGFVIVINNTTSLFPGVERLAILATNRGQVGDSGVPGYSMFNIAVNGLRSVVAGSKEPDADLKDHPDFKEFLQWEDLSMVVSSALNTWAKGTTEEERENVWILSSPETRAIMEIVEELLRR